MNNMDVAAHILLTGAGFTHNFGAPLGTEVWGLIVGHPEIRKRPLMRALLLKDFDFESVYHTVMKGAFESEDKAAMKQAVCDAFEYVDSTVRAYLFRGDGPHSVNIYGVQRFIARFSGTSARPGCFRETLASGDKRLLVCGYSFRDTHITEAIAVGVRDHRLKVFVLSPVDPAAFKEALLKNDYGEAIWSGLHGYFRHTLLDLFPASQDETPAWKFLCRSYWEKAA